MELLVEDKCMYDYRLIDDFDDVKDIFWDHSDSIKLFNNFSIVFVMGLTYKTDMYCIMLLQFVGVISTELMYSIAFAKGKRCHLSSKEASGFVEISIYFSQSHCH